MTTNKNLSTPANNSSNWDVPLNANFNEIDLAFGGLQPINLGSYSGSTIVLTNTYPIVSSPLTSLSYIPLTLDCSGALIQNVVIQIPSGVGGQWIVRNRTSGAYTITINSGGGGTSVVIVQGASIPIFSDGTNISFTNTQASPGSDTQVIYNSSGTLVGSSNLTFDGKNLTAGGTIKSSSGGFIFPDSTTQTTAAAIPSGSMTLFAASTPPTGWLECNGALVSTTTYANLYAAIGTTFGSGSGTFGLPDMRGYFARGWDHGAGVDPSRTFGSTQTDAFQGHLHPQTGQTLIGSSSGIPGGFSGIVFTVESANTGSPINDGTNGSPRTASETRPKNVALMYIIKT